MVQTKSQINPLNLSAPKFLSPRTSKPPRTPMVEKLRCPVSPHILMLIANDDDNVFH